MKEVTWLCFSFSPCFNTGNWSAAPASNFLKASAERFCQLLRLSSGPWSLIKYLSGPWSPVGTPFLRARSVIIQYARIQEPFNFRLRTSSAFLCKICVEGFDFGETALAYDQTSLSHEETSPAGRD